MVSCSSCFSCHCILSEHEDIKWVYLHTHKGDTRRRWVKVIHSRAIQLFLGILLLLDVLILFTQIFIDAEFPPCFSVENSAECLAVDGVNTSILDGVFLHCTSEDNELLQEVKSYLFYASLGILGAFELELIFLLQIMGCWGFFRNFGNLFDFFIVSTSLCLEVFLHNDNNSSAVGLLIGARVWRLVRIGHGILYSNATRRRALGEVLSVVDSEISLEHKEEVEMDAIEETSEDALEKKFQEEEREEQLIKQAKSLKKRSGPNPPPPVAHPPASPPPSRDSKPPLKTSI